MREARNKPTRKTQVVVEPKKETVSEPLNLEITGAIIKDEKTHKSKKSLTKKQKN